MVRLSTLGSLELRGNDGVSRDTLLSQEKRVALLVYLSVARAGTMHRRDLLLLLVWPELEGRRARAALSKSLHVLRHSLGATCIVTRGADEVGIDPGSLWCDAIAFRAAVEADRFEEALRIYRGDFLDSFRGAISRQFEEWVRLERGRIRSLAARAARALAERHEREKNYTLAVDFARRALELTADERALRRLMELFERAGDRAAAVRAFETFAARLWNELRIPPSSETEQLASRLRSAEPRFSPIVGPAPPVARGAGRPPSSYAGTHGALAQSPLSSSSAVATPNSAQLSPSTRDALPNGVAFGDLAGAPRIPGYEIIREIDRGGAAIVYLACDEKHGRPVAIKVLKPELTESIQAERFLREIGIIAHLSHPHILQLLDSGRTGALLYYITTFVAGESLRRRLDQHAARQLPIAEATAVAIQVARALDHAHRQGIVHRDVKPENILLAEDQAIVADFGIARAMTLADDERMTLTQMRVGTPLYMSPEQCTGDSELDGRSDIYSLACVLYEMLTGRPPFRGSPSKVIAQHATAPVPSMRQACPLVAFALERAVLKALSKSPADRYATAAEFAEALAGVRERGAQWLDAWRWLRRSRAVRYAAAISMVVAAASGAWRAIEAKRTSDLLALTDLTHIAVLYFDDLTPDAAQGHIAAGLTEDLIDDLSQVQALRVISPEGVRQFRGRSVSLDSITRTLGVQTLVSGSLARSDSTLRLTVRLTDARTGHQMQSRTFEHPIQDLFVLQDELAVQVTEFLRQRLGREIRLREQLAEARSVYAWELVQRAQELAESGATGLREGRRAEALHALARADTMFERAAALDPSWTAPVVGRGWAALSLALVSPGPDAIDSARLLPLGTVSTEWVRRAIAHADQALRKTEAHPTALALRGAALWQLGTLWTSAGRDTLLTRGERDLQAALAARPDFAGAWSFLALTYSDQARFIEASDAARTALDADAYLVNRQQILATLISASLHAERFEEAEGWCRFARARHDGDPRFVNCELMLLGWRGAGARDVNRAWRLLSSIEMDTTTGSTLLWAYRRLMVAALLARSGMTDSARAVLEHTRHVGPRVAGALSMPMEEAWVLTLLGDHEAAVERLAVHVAASPDARAHVVRSPQFRELRTQPAFRALIAMPADTARQDR